LFDRSYLCTVIDEADCFLIFIFFCAMGLTEVDRHTCSVFLRWYCDQMPGHPADHRLKSAYNPGWIKLCLVIPFEVHNPLSEAHSLVHSFKTYKKALVLNIPYQNIW